jgi:hypothetical protein
MPTMPFNFNPIHFLCLLTEDRGECAKQNADKRKPDELRDKDTACQSNYHQNYAKHFHNTYLLYSSAFFLAGKALETCPLSSLGLREVHGIPSLITFLSPSQFLGTIIL